MEKIVLSFVGWDLSFDKPFACSRGGHSNARSNLHYALDDYECTFEERTEFKFGFVAYKEETGECRVVNRCDAYNIAKLASQLKPLYGTGGNTLESYMLDFAPIKIEDEEKLCKMREDNFNKLKKKEY